VHPNLIAARVEDRRRSCPCGAVTGEPHQLCPKCLVRRIWRRRLGGRFQSVVRRHANRRARALALTLAVATSALRILGRGARN
jgi:hypothetical protein